MLTIGVVGVLTRAGIDSTLGTVMFDELELCWGAWAGGLVKSEIGKLGTVVGKDELLGIEIGKFSTVVG